MSESTKNLSQDFIDFGQWWDEVGSGITPMSGDDMESHAHAVAHDAWIAARKAPQSTLCELDLIAKLQDEVDRLRNAKDNAYEERNRCVALIARMAIALGLKACVTKTAIEGWSEDWHGCVFIDLPTGQVSWHFHDSQAHLFDGIPYSAVEWDGHSTGEKYERVKKAYK